MMITKERWRELCKQAAIEKDPGKLIQICDEINSILQRASHASEQSGAIDKLNGTNGRPA
jgi:hypothetical protein